MNKHLWAQRLRGCVSTTDKSLMTPTEYIVLTMLATWTNSAGDGARPAIATLAHACGTGERTVQRTLASLVKKGYITVERKGGGKANPTTYRLVELPPIPRHPDDTVTTSKPRHPDVTVAQTNPDTQVSLFEPQRVTNDDPYGDTQVSPDQVDQELQGGYVSRELTSARATDPNPTPRTRGALALVVSAAPDADLEPPDRCPRHRTRIGRIDEPCAPCRDARLAHAAWAERTTRRAAEQRATAAHDRRTAIDRCPRCDEFGWQLDPTGQPADPARRCDHQETPR